MSKRNKTYKKLFKVFTTGMVEGRCMRIREGYWIGAKNKKHAIELAKEHISKHTKYHAHEVKNDKAIPCGSVVPMSFNANR